MLEQLQSYFEEQIPKWNNFPNRVDTSYTVELKKESMKHCHLNLYKVSPEENMNNFITGVEFCERRYLIHFFLDEEEAIIVSLEQAGYVPRLNHWMKEFTIEVATLEEVKAVYEQHVWCFDPGPLY